MKIQNIQLPKIIKSLAIATPLLLASPAIRAQQIETNQQDVFIKTVAPKDKKIIADSLFMSPELIVGGKEIYPAIVVDLSEGQLYHYDYDTYLKEIYPIASGKTTTPTKTGLRIINNIEKYPYKNAPKSTKRYNNPDDYGTHLLNLSIVDPKTGDIIGNNGQFIHGTNKPNSIGQKASKGCIRVQNEVIDKLASSLEAGQYVLIKE